MNPKQLFLLKIIKQYNGSVPLRDITSSVTQLQGMPEKQILKMVMSLQTKGLVSFENGYVKAL